MHFYVKKYFESQPLSQFQTHHNSKVKRER